MEVFPLIISLYLIKLDFKFRAEGKCAFFEGQLLRISLQNKMIIKRGHHKDQPPNTDLQYQ